MLKTSHALFLRFFGYRVSLLEKERHAFLGYKQCDNVACAMMDNLAKSGSNRHARVGNPTLWTARTANIHSPKLAIHCPKRFLNISYLYCRNHVSEWK